MTHDELLAKIDEVIAIHRRLREQPIYHNALRAVVELHISNESGEHCKGCGSHYYPCETIEAIEKELK